MTPSSPRLTVPAYLTDFHCLGPVCEDHCCYGWDIFVDRASYQRYRKLKTTPLASLLEKSVRRNRSDPSDERYARIQRNGEDCPFLTRGRLCRLQAELGEAYLPDVCAVFPRRWRARRNGIEGSASLACPDIARRALADPDGIRLVQTPLEGPPPRAVDPLLPAEAEAVGMRLREVALALIGNRRYPIWERLLRLGIVYETVDRLPSAAALKRMESLTRQAEDPAFARALADAPVLTGLQLQIVRRLHEEKRPSVRVRAFGEMAAAGFAGLDWADGRPFEEAVGRRYDEAFQRFYRPFFQPLPHLLENYLCHTILHNDPGFQPGRIFADYLALVIYFTMLKTYLIGLAAHDGPAFTPERVVRLISAFTKVTEPDTAFRRFALELLAQSGCTDLLRVGVLLRN
jgi:lysine-N-methylase